jgi:hypothetical protein
VEKESFSLRKSKGGDEGMTERCGNCKHSDNDLGLVALHCELIYGTTEEDGGLSDGKVRSWEKCNFKPSKWEERRR